MYNNFYGFSCSPFENTLNPEFFFPSVVHREGLASVLYGVKQSKGLMLITGDIGAGKTQILFMLKNMLMEEHDSRILEISNPWIAADELIDLVAADLGVKSGEKQKRNHLFVQIKSKLSSLRAAGSRYMVLIDEAQLLDNQTFEALRLLSNIEEDGNKLIQLVLVGQLELLGRLQESINRPLLQRVTLHSQLDYLSEEQTAVYINYRLEKAGCKSNMFTSKALSAIYAAAQGSPRMINQFCDSCLILAYTKKEKQVGDEIVDIVVRDSPQTLLNRYEVIEVDDRSNSSTVADALDEKNAEISPSDTDPGLKNKTKEHPVINIPAPAPQKAPLQPSSKHDFNRWVALACLVLIMLVIILWGRQESAYQPSTSVVEDVNTPAAVQPVVESFVESPTDNTSAYRAKFDYRGLEAQRSLSASLGRPKPLGTVGFRSGVTQSDKPASIYDTEGGVSSPTTLGAGPRVDFPFDKGSLATAAVAKSGWSLSRLAREQYGTWTATVEDIVRAANPTLVDFNKIKAGDPVRFPYLSRADLLTQGQEGELFLYYGSYVSEGKASRDRELLGMKGVAVVVEPALWGSNTIYRLYLGPYRGYSQARARLSELTLPKFTKVFSRELSAP